MTADRQELDDVVDELANDQVAAAIADLRAVACGSLRPRPWPPKFFGAGVAEDGRTDIATKVGKYLAEGFGQSRS